MDKQFIVDEIRRTAQENNDVPLGRRAFTNTTGIKEGDWIGRYWVRWGDAVREAGLAPNKKKVAFDDSLLMEKIIGLTRELGRLPTVWEVRMRKRSDASFPNDRVFSRYGTKQQLAAKIRQYCEGRAGYEDVAPLCAVVITEPVPHSAGKENGKSQDVLGFVYLLKSGRYYKIGRSNAVGRRERELAIQLPAPAATVHSIKTDDPVGIEEYWHKRFETKRKHGEWFELDAGDIRAFRRRKFM